MTRRLPIGFEVIEVGRTIYEEAEHDVEHQMNLAVTQQELGIILFALHFPHCLFPEVRQVIESLCKKISEVGEAQDFLAPREDE